MTPLMMPTPTEADRQAFHTRLAGRLQSLRPEDSPRGEEAIPVAGLNAAEAGKLVRRVLSSGDTVTLDVFDATGRLHAREFRVRSPRMGVLLDALVPLIELSLDPRAQRGAQSDGDLLAMIQQAAASDRSPLRATVERLVAEVFQQPADVPFWCELPWESGARALEVVADMVPFGKLRAHSLQLATRAAHAGQSLAG